jgi:hypothetical protein
MPFPKSINRLLFPATGSLVNDDFTHLIMTVEHSPSDAGAEHFDPLYSLGD